MAVYYYNGNQILAPFTIESNKPVYADDTVSLKHIRGAQSGQRWELSFSVLTNDNVVETFLNIIDEIETSSTMVMPQFKEVDDLTTLATSTFTTSANYSAGEDELVTGITGGSGILPRGSFIKFADHAKVYVLLDGDVGNASTNRDGSVASQTIKVYPTLRQNVPSGTSIQYAENCSITYWRTIDNLQGVTYRDGILADPGNITLIEAL